MKATMVYRFEAKKDPDAVVIEATTYKELVGKVAVEMISLIAIGGYVESVIFESKD